VITSSEAKVEKLKALGATEVLNSTITAAWEQVVLELTGGRGVEHVVEAVGPATLEQSIKASGFDSQIALMGVFPSEAPDHSGFNPKVLSARLLTIRRIVVGSRAAFTAMNQAIALHQLHPVIDRSFSFSQALEAYRYFDKARPFGEVVISSE
jgi:NADPH:quinone reductase-like Zn-dependent oxidoreductase